MKLKTKKEIESFLAEILSSDGYVLFSSCRFQRVLRDVEHWILVSQSSLDGSFYIEAYVSIEGNKDINDSSYVLGGRVSPAAVDFLDYSIPNDFNEFKVVFNRLYLGVITPWFNTYSGIDVVNNAYEEIRVFSVDDYLRLSFSPINPDIFLVLLDGFSDAVHEFGFEISTRKDSLCLSKYNGFMWDLVLIEFCGNGSFAAVRVANWLPELQVTDERREGNHPSEYDDLLLVNGGYINGGSVSSHPTEVILLCETQNITCSGERILELVKTTALEFFSGVVSIGDFLDSVDSVYKKSSYYVNVFEELVRTKGQASQEEK